MPARRSISEYQRQAGKQPLRFTANGTFQISVFSDLHFAEDDENDKKTQKVMDNVLSSEEVQLVVLNGDLISGEATHASNSSTYLDRVVAPLVDHNIPWASTYGNHDSEVNLDPEETFRRERNYTNSLTQKMVSGPTSGITNYYLPIFRHDASNNTDPAFILWFFDSQGGHYPKTASDNGTVVPRQDWVDESVVKWFTKTNSKLLSTYGKPIPSLAFVHIPVYAMRAFQVTGVSPTSEPGINNERVQQQGYASEGGYEAQDYPLIRALLNTTGLVATFSGHDHDNDWCFKWDSKLPELNFTGNGINMCYGRHSGYGGYGDWARGGRQIMLDQQSLASDMQSWVRMEDGSISGNVHLNATYGQDRYRLVERSTSGQANVAPQYSSLVYLWVFVFYLFMQRFGL
ncbi:unnamed protein product [Penicillium salamii]|uniref:Calcineurin-like phosphoesterase domain-containing protein n=1 Tax=Penicillium salamii TaxID=1612424 RepID=A0A9W4JST0_9EURO|nr:unnamed protein product [Penicillium salamii]